MPTAHPSASVQCCTRVPDDGNLREGLMIGQTSVLRVVSSTRCSTSCFRMDLPGADGARGDRARGMEHSPLLACFHPYVEQLFEERVAIHRNLEEWRRLGRRREGAPALEPRPEPTLDDVRRKYEPFAGKRGRGSHRAGRTVSVGHLLGQPRCHCRGRPLRDIGSFRGAGAFLDEYLTRDQEAGETATTCGSTWERFGSPDAPT